jgi:hypothetical protein
VGSEVQVLPGPYALPGDGWRVGPDGPGVSFGGVAQLVEHLLCKQGVTGSNPVASRWSMHSVGGLWPAGGASGKPLGYIARCIGVSVVVSHGEEDLVISSVSSYG